MYTIQVQNKHYKDAIFRDITGADINVAFRKVVIMLKNDCSSDQAINQLSLSDITPNNVVKLAESYGYILTDVTEKYNQNNN